MTPGQINLIIKRSLLHERTREAIQAKQYITVDLGFLFQLMMGDAALVFPDTDIVSEFDNSPMVLEYADELCVNSTAKIAKEFIIHLGQLGFDNLHYNLVCKWHLAFSSFEIKKFQQEAQNLMTLIR